MAEGLNVDDHSYGSLFDPRVNANLSAHHNLYISNRSLDVVQIISDVALLSRLGR